MNQTYLDKRTIMVSNVILSNGRDEPPLAAPGFSLLLLRSQLHLDCQDGDLLQVGLMSTTTKMFRRDTMDVLQRPGVDQWEDGSKF